MTLDLFSTSMLLPRWDRRESMYTLLLLPVNLPLISSLHIVNPCLM